MCLTFAKKHKKGAELERFVNVYLSEIESLGLDWCKMLQVPRTYWQAENFLALSRVIPSIFGHFFENDFLPTSASKQAMAVKQMLNALHVMISAIMSPKLSNDADKIDSYIKFWLSCCHRASVLVHGEGSRKNLIWIGDGNGKGNFISSLNLESTR